MQEIEESLPCPHDPIVLSQLFLKGTSKLNLEETAARKSQHLLVLNNNQPIESLEINPNIDA